MILFSILLSLISFENGYSLVKFFQSNKININGSISITFTYSAKIEEIEKNNNKIGNLPFTAEGAKQFFSSPDVELKKALIYNDPSDNTVRAVTLDIVARDINKLSEIEALKDFKTKYLNSDSGMVFSWLVPTDFIKTNSIDTYQFVLSSESEIKSTNGLRKEGKIDWYVFSEKINPGGAYFVATINVSSENKSEIQSTDKNAAGKEKINSETKNEIKNEPKPDEIKKTCSIFGFEFPVIILVGMLLSKRKRKFSTRKKI